MGRDASPPLPEPRAGVGMAIMGRNLHVFSGLAIDRDTDMPDHWILNIDNPTHWEVTAPVPLLRNHFATVVLDQTIYTVGGQFRHDRAYIGSADNDIPYVMQYDTLLNRWRAVAPLTIPRSHTETSTVVYNGRILAMGGRDNTRVSAQRIHSTIEEYDPRTNTWRMIGEIPEQLLAPTVVIYDGHIYLTAGGFLPAVPSLSTWVADIELVCE